VSHGAPITDVDAHRRTALHAMAHCGSDKGCRAFVELGLSPAAEDKDGKLPMHYAAMGGQADALQYLLQARRTSESSGTQASSITYVVTATQY
jgi:ankyrin repeat protein